MTKHSTALPDGARATDFSQYRNGGIFQIDLLHADFLTKKTEWEMSVGPDDDLDVDSAGGLASEEAAHQLVFFPCRTMGEVARKAQAIRSNMWLSDVAASQFDDFLASLIPEGRAHK